MTDAKQPTAGAAGTCPDFEALSCYVDGELEAARAAQVAAHVDHCGRCATLSLRLREGLGDSEARRDGGIGGSGCASGEQLVLYAAGGLDGSERAALVAHLASCDACVETVAVVHSRLALAPTVETPIPLAVQRRAAAVLVEPMGELAPSVERARPLAVEDTPGWLERLRGWLRVPVLIPAAVAAGALLMVSVVHQPSASDGERSRALAPAAVRLRVTATEARVYARPSQNSELVGSVHRGAMLEVAGEERDWYEIHLEGGRPGWVAREAFE